MDKRRFWLLLIVLLLGALVIGIAITASQGSQSQKSGHSWEEPFPPINT